MQTGNAQILSPAKFTLFEKGKATAVSITFNPVRLRERGHNSSRTLVPAFAPLHIHPTQTNLQELDFLEVMPESGSPRLIDVLSVHELRLARNVGLVLRPMSRGYSPWHSVQFRLPCTPAYIHTLPFPTPSFPTPSSGHLAAGLRRSGAPARAGRLLCYFARQPLCAKHAVSQGRTGHHPDVGPGTVWRHSRRPIQDARLHRLSPAHVERGNQRWERGERVDGSDPIDFVC